MQESILAIKEAPAKDDDVDPFTMEEQELILGAMSGQGKNLFQFALCPDCDLQNWLRSIEAILTGAAA